MTNTATRPPEAKGAGFKIRHPERAEVPDYYEDSETGCWMWRWGINGGGLPQASYGPKKSSTSVARILFMIRYPRTRSDAFVIKNDKCTQRRKLCINPLHHKAVHHKSNKANLERQRRMQANLSRAREIRSKYNPLVYSSYGELGKEYNLSDDMVGKILRNKIWCEPTPNSKFA